MNSLLEIFINPGSSNSSSIFGPAVISALIAAMVSIPGIIISIKSQKSQRLQSERNEIYKKLNDFYGPMRLLLKNSDELYKLLKLRMNSKVQGDFHMLTYILEGNFFDKTEDALVRKIIEIGVNIENTIQKNAGLIDDDDLNCEMIELSTHIRIIRMAYNKEFDKGIDVVELLRNKTFPKLIVKKIDTTFHSFKWRLKELNERTKERH